MARRGYEFEVDTIQFERRLKLYDQKNRAAAKKQLRRNALDLEKEAKNLCPVAENTLMDSGKAGRVKGDYPEMTVSVSFSTPYARKVHEAMLPAIPIEGPQMHPGKDTKKKPPTRFGPAGGKYLYRPLVGKGKEYAKEIADAMKKIK